MSGRNGNTRIRNADSHGQGAGGRRKGRILPLEPGKAPENGAGKIYRLSPSDFAFLWKECKRCYWLKTSGRLPRPFGVMPKIFNVIDSRMKGVFHGKHTAEFGLGLPPGKFAHSDRMVESEPIVVPGRKAACVIRGKFDTVLDLDDASHAVADFKTASVRPENLALYAPQLHGYAYALEHPAPGALCLKPVTKLGLIAFEPDGLAPAGNERFALSGPVRWIEIPKNDQAFLTFLGEVMEVLELPEPPASAGNCAWCKYRDEARRTGL